MRVVGLTGGIGTGKSSVARLFAELGARVIDADQLARDVVEPGTPGLAAIVARFGDGVLDAEGRLDRKKLAAIVFGDAAARAALNAIVHPAVRRRALEQIQAASDDGAELVVYDVPLLFETGLDRELPDVIVVTARPDVQRARVAARDAMSPEDIEARIAAQLPVADKVARATWVIENSGTRDETRAQVERLFATLTGRT
ncbi:dephospho-CoA kinase [Myxococcota bacterium]|nr:dephospho-CoA kinase [Myxococcota bacterium]